MPTPRPRLALLALALLSAGAAHAAGLYRFQASDYALVIEGEAPAPVFAKKLASLDRLLAELTGVEPVPAGHGLTIIEVPRSVWNRLVPGGRLESAFVPGRFTDYMLLDGFHAGGGLRAPGYAEYTRHFLQRRAARHFPTWYEEGLTELMYHAMIATEHATVGDSHFYGYSSLRTRVPASASLAVNDLREKAVVDLGRENVTTSMWLLVYRGIVDEPEFGANTAKYLASTRQLQSVEDSVRSAFGTTLADFDSAQAAYERRWHQRTRRFSFAAPEPARSRLDAAEKIDDARFLALLCRALLDGGARPGTVAPILKALEKEAPNSIDARILRLRSAILERDIPAIARLKSELESRVGAWDSAREYGLVLADEALVLETDPTIGKASAERGLQLMTASMLVRPADPEAAWAFAIFALRLGRNLDAATAHLARTRPLAPRNAEFIIAQALVEEARGHTATAKAYLLEVVQHARSREKQEWAVRRMDALAPPSPADR